MSMHDYLERAREFEGVLELAPEEGGPFPEIAWGDHFFYYAPDGQTPQQGQPFATFVTKDYPDDALSELDRAGRWRLNIHVGRHRFVLLTGEEPRLSRDVSGTVWDFAATDTVIPHPVYRAQGWIAVVTPSRDSLAVIVSLLEQAHADAKRRWHRIK
ncbi:DUF6194 family protein [Brevibacterium aurantiacum]|uniref:DUF6194 domain-containing protein n=1 Tax=Brevibacterium aurantiacum TaxID=273384 RepID=A0A2A3ZP37_BREAU|nr:DUF6194 family protein [Brevibacterium aurantiacum]AZT92429.1 hypothetical protein CXR23_04155 [Brevibacterium aurantiacum]PCC53314.1 hypothetical protein CIK59_11370 [Brevibacterium aurantiacum]